MIIIIISMYLCIINVIIVIVIFVIVGNNNNNMLIWCIIVMPLDCFGCVLLPMCSVTQFLPSQISLIISWFPRTCLSLVKFSI